MEINSNNTVSNINYDIEYYSKLRAYYESKSIAFRYMEDKIYEEETIIRAIEDKIREENILTDKEFYSRNVQTFDNTGMMLI